MSGQILSEGVGTVTRATCPHALVGGGGSSLTFYFMWTYVIISDYRGQDLFEYIKIRPINHIIND